MRTTAGIYLGCSLRNSLVSLNTSTEYLFGVKAVPVFRVLWVLAIPVGATTQLDVAWLIADTLNALMALPNLIALLLLSPVVFKLTKEFLSEHPK